MKYCDKINYRICAADRSGFLEMVDSLLSLLPDNEKIVRLVFFGSPDSNETYFEQRNLIVEQVKQVCVDGCPSVSYVAQRPLKGDLLMEVHSYQADPSDNVMYKQCRDFPYVVVENPTGRFLFASGFQSHFVDASLDLQLKVVFDQIDTLFSHEGFPVNSIVRQWNYIERITDYTDGVQRYQAFNDARSLFYDTDIWPVGYPAATGIGMQFGGILVDLDAVVFNSSDCQIVPIDNRLQIAAHAYSEHVLAVGTKLNSTPKFERAKSLVCADKELVYISGTAAIRGEESLVGVGLARQLQITMENIDQLIKAGAEFSMLRIYLKEQAFADEAEQLMQAYKLSIPVSYLWADVCRQELLIEIEGVAKC